MRESASPFAPRRADGDFGADGGRGTAGGVLSDGSITSMNLLTKRHGQLVYWSSIGWDCLRGSGSASRSIYVLGFSGSGTNWLCHLVSGVTGIPILEVWRRRWPQLGPAVFHMHRFVPVDSVRRRTIYIMRDGRDAIVTLYFHTIRNPAGFLKAPTERAMGCELTAENIRENLPRFIQYVQHSWKGAADYRTHLHTWLEDRDKYVAVRYEDLLKDTGGELSRVIAQVTGSPPEPELVRSVVEKHDFARLTTRAPGVEDPRSFLRKGIRGDWRNYFSQEAAQVFDEYAGDLLVELGYEPDRQWALRSYP